MPPEEPAADGTAQQVNDLLDSPELAKAVETEKFKVFLDHVPIAIVISKLGAGDQRIVYANKAFEDLVGNNGEEVAGRGWSVLDSFKQEDEPHLIFSEAEPAGDDYLGTFKRLEPGPTLVEAYSSVIDNDDGAESYRIVALLDVTERERAQREEFARQIREKDLVLKEVQHRVKNNLQLVTALIRLEAKTQRRRDVVNLDALAGRIEALQLLYQAMLPDALGDDVDLGQYLGKITSAAMTAHGVDGVRLDLKIDHAPASINVAMPIGLIVNELLTNAFKHAFGGGSGVITLECLRTGDNSCRVVVADDGSGLPPGTDWPVPGKIGALIVQSLHENTKADISVETAPGAGTRITIEFVPKAPRERNHSN